MANKIIKIGSSAAVTIPKKVLSELTMAIGDKVFVNIDAKNKRIIIEPLVNFQLKEETAQHIEEFIKQYKKELEALS